MWYEHSEMGDESWGTAWANRYCESTLGACPVVA